MSTTTRAARKRLGVEHADPVARVVQPAEVGHQPLGVQRPALAVAGAPAQQPLPAVEQVGAVDGLGDLQVMPGDALVEDGGRLLPGRERSSPSGTAHHIRPGREKSSLGPV